MLNQVQHDRPDVMVVDGDLLPGLTVGIYVPSEAGSNQLVCCCCGASYLEMLNQVQHDRPGVMAVDGDLLPGLTVGIYVPSEAGSNQLVCCCCGASYLEMLNQVQHDRPEGTGLERDIVPALKVCMIPTLLITGGLEVLLPCRPGGGAATEHNQPGGSGIMRWECGKTDTLVR